MYMFEVAEQNKQLLSVCNNEEVDKKLFLHTRLKNTNMLQFQSTLITR